MTGEQMAQPKISVYRVKCVDCHKLHTFYACQIGRWHWYRCARCGAHTSSYLTQEKAAVACVGGEHYVSENGNKCIYT